MNFLTISSDPLDGKVFETFSRQNNEWHSIGQTYNIDSGLKRINEEKPNLVLYQIRSTNQQNCIENIALMRHLDPKNYVVAYSILFNEYELLQSTIESGAYAFLEKPIQIDNFNTILHRIFLNLNNVKSELDKESPFSSTQRFEKDLFKLFESPISELKNNFDIIWNRYIKDKADVFSRTLIKCQKIGTQLFYDISELQDNNNNETIVLIYNSFLLNLTKIDSTLETKQLLLNYIKDCSLVINKDQMNISSDRVNAVKKTIDLYIEKEKNISLDIIANELFISPSYLSRTFREVEGVKFIDYINIKRVEKAKLLLSTTNETVENISFHCGYNEPNSFRRLFKQKTGMTPNEYRAIKNKN